MLTTRNKLYILLILCIVWTTIIFIGCSLPPKALPKWHIPNFDKVAHFVFFFVQSVLLSLLLHYKTGKSYFQIALLSTLQAFVYGGFIELLQSELFNRSGDFYDLIADVLGGFAGAFSYPAFARLLKRNT